MSGDTGTAAEAIGPGGPGGGTSPRGIELGPSVFPPAPSLRPTLHGTRGLVVASHPIAASVADAVLERGGNAVDAGVAGGLAMSVVQPDMCNFGGIAPMLVKAPADPTVWSIAGVGTWSTTATIDRFVARHGRSVPTGCAWTVVPAAPAAWLAALARFGSWQFGDVAQWAIELAAQGFPVDAAVAAGLTVFGPTLSQWESTARICWPEGRPPAVGERLRQPELARTLSQLAAAEAGAPSRTEGLGAVRRAFYEGDVAEAIVRFVTEHGGFLTTEDLAGFTADVAPAPGRRYRELTVHATPAWSQGPALLQALAILEALAVGDLEHSSADHLHVLAEAVKLSCSDRERFYGDPAFVRIPMDELLSDEHAAELRSRIKMTRAQPDLPTLRETVPSTAHLTVVDAAGYAFAVAPSDALTLGPVVPGLGIVASVRGVQSRLDPDHPASLEPGKRPRVTPAPALALDRDSNPWPIAAAGGDMILQATLQAFSNVVDFGMTLQQAVEAPRVASLAFPNSFHPHGHVKGQLCLEARIDVDVVRELATRGHRVQEWPHYEFDAGSVGMTRKLANGTLAAGADPRRAAYGAGR